MTACLAVLGANDARADWSGFYKSTLRKTVVTGQASCVREIMQAQVRHGIPGNLLLGIGLQEAGMKRDGVLTIWPYTANAEGNGKFFESETEAIAWVSNQLSSGVTSIDVGCMQINLRWHPNAFADLSDGFDPEINVDYAARLLRDLYRQTGDWTEAAGSYHSFTPEFQNVYLTRLRTNLAVANNQIDGFRALAGQSEPVEVSSPEGGILWTAWLGTDASNAGEPGQTFYGNGNIEPLLPQLQRSF